MFIIFYDVLGGEVWKTLTPMTVMCPDLKGVESMEIYLTICSLLPMSTQKREVNNQS